MFKAVKQLTLQGKEKMVAVSGTAVSTAMMLGTQVHADAIDTTAVTTTFSTMTTTVLTVIGAVAASAVTVMGIILAWKYGRKLFGMLAK